MEKEKIENLKKQFSPEYYKVSDKDGKLVINEKKTAAWLPKRFTKDLPVGNPKALSDYLIDLIEATDFNATYFEMEQKSVTLKCSKLISNKAKECNTTKFAFISAVLEGEV